MERGINCYQVGGSEAEEVIKRVCVWGRGGGGEYGVFSFPRRIPSQQAK